MARKQIKRARSGGSRAKTPHLKHFLIPGPHNVYRPLFLQIESFIATAIAIGILFAIALAAEKLVVKSPASQVGAVIAAVLVDLANADREKEGLPALAMDTALQEAAQRKADDMALREYFSHETPEGLDPWYWFEKAGYGFRYAGENLAVYFSDSAEVEKAWMNSPLHRANILSDKFTEIGIAIAQGRYEGHETTFVVQMFGNPGNSEEVSKVVSSVVGPSETIAGASAEAQPIGAIKDNRSSTLWRILTSPRTTLQYAYAGIAALVALALALLFIVELHRLHVPSFFRGIALLVLIGGLLYSTTLVSGNLLIL